MLTAATIRALLTCDGQGRLVKADLLAQLLRDLAQDPARLDEALKLIERAKL